MNKKVVIVAVMEKPTSSGISGYYLFKGNRYYAGCVVAIERQIYRVTGRGIRLDHKLDYLHQF